jgi:hypothetical protein
MDVRQQPGSASSALRVYLGLADPGRILRLGRMAMDTLGQRIASQTDGVFVAPQVVLNKKNNEAE